VLTLAEVARVLGLGRTTIYRLIREKKMKVINVGRRTLVPLEVVDAILASGL
jgi:excisionase family DNA binding protein